MADDTKGPSTLQLALRKIADEPKKVAPAPDHDDSDLATAISEWESASDPKAKAKAFRAALKIAQLNN